MPIFTKTLISGLVASIFIIAAPLTINNASAQPYQPALEMEQADENEVERSIVVKAKQGKPIHVVIDEEGRESRFELTSEELADSALLEKKLAGLDRETAAKVRKTLTAVNKSMLKMKGLDNDSQIIVTLDGDDIDSDVDFNPEVLESLEILQQLGDLDQLKELAELGKLKDLRVLEKLMSKEHATVIRHRVHQERMTKEHRREMAAHEREMEMTEREMEVAEREVEAGERKMHHRRMIIVDGESANVVFNDDDMSDIDVEVHRFKLGDNNMVLKGHVDAILKLISHGEFTADELDKLQQLLDSKR